MVFSAKRYDFAARKFDEQLYMCDMAAADALATTVNALRTVASDATNTGTQNVIQLTAIQLKTNNSPAVSPTCYP